jgi:hypothetical protein
VVSRFFRLLRCGARLIAACWSSNWEAFDNVVADIDREHGDA